MAQGKEKLISASQRMSVLAFDVRTGETWVDARLDVGLSRAGLVSFCVLGQSGPLFTIGISFDEWRRLLEAMRDLIDMIEPRND
jgi:hypothetical protein